MALLKKSRGKRPPTVGMKDKQRSEAAALFISLKGIDRNNRALRHQYKKREKRTRTKGIRWGMVIIPIAMVAILVGGLWLAYQEFMRITPASAPVVSEYEPPPSSGTVSLAEDPRKRLLTVVNNKTSLPDDFALALTTFEGDIQCDEKVAEPLRELLEAAEKAGYTLRVEYGYIDAATQQQRYEAAVQSKMNEGFSRVKSETEVKKVVQPGGCSDYQTGLSVRVVGDSEGNFGSSEEYKWLSAHCADYGFVIRYPSSKESETGASFDPSHLRYVGVENAQKMRTLDMCLEEYAEYAGEQEEN